MGKRKISEKAESNEFTSYWKRNDIADAAVHFSVRGGKNLTAMRPRGKGAVPRAKKSQEMA